jgi:hypothetical protein
MRLAILVLVLLAGPATARADDVIWTGAPVAPGAPGMMAPSYYNPPPPTAVHEVSYAYQTLISDGIATVLITSAFLRGGGGEDWLWRLMAFTGGVGIYAGGAPLVHFVNGEIHNGLKSFGLRVGLPTIGMMAGNLIGPRVRVQCKVGQDCPNSDESPVGIAVGAVAGAVAASLLDARLLAKKRVTEFVQLTPMIGYGRSGFNVGLGGSF